MALRYILFDTTLFGPGDDTLDARKDLMWILEALTQRNQDYLKQRPNTPSLYKSGVVYELPQQMLGFCPEVKTLRDNLGLLRSNKPSVRAALDTVQMVLGGERFRDIGRIIENGCGDCDNLACWRAAELRQAGIPAKPIVTARERLGGGTTYHALVRWPAIPGVPYETDEDPSLILGMGGEARALVRAEEIRKNAERCEHLQTAGGSMSTNVFSSLVEELLGVRKQPPQPPTQAEMDRLLRSLGMRRVK